MNWIIGLIEALLGLVMPNYFRRPQITLEGESAIERIREGVQVTRTQISCFNRQRAWLLSRVYPVDEPACEVEITVTEPQELAGHVVTPLWPDGSRQRTLHSDSSKQWITVGYVLGSAKRGYLGEQPIDTQDRIFNEQNVLTLKIEIKSGESVLAHRMYSARLDAVAHRIMVQPASR